MKITRKLVTSYVLVSLLIIIVGAIGIFGMSNINKNANMMYKEKTEALTTLLEIRERSDQVRLQSMSAISGASTSLATEAEKGLNEVDKFTEKFNNYNLTVKDRELFNNYRSKWQKYSDLAKSNLNYIKQEDYILAEKGMTKSGEYFDSASNHLRELQEQIKMEAQKLRDDNHRIFQRLFFLTTIISLLAFTVAIGIGVKMGNSIGKPLELATKKLKQITEGDLTGETIKIHRKDEIGEIVKSANHLSDSLRDIIIKINEVSSIVTSHSDELSQSAQEVSASTEQASSTLQEIAAGSEKQAHHSTELSVMIETFVDHLLVTGERGEEIYLTANSSLSLTKEGQQLMDSSNVQMRKIDNLVQESVQKVYRLDEELKEIYKLVIVIKEIADQTNLLALNAAIEAARAGEHGRGFVVVAEEVRKLAEEVAHSVKDITEIVNNIRNEFNDVTESLQTGYKEVEIGTEKIKITSDTFIKINHSIMDVAKSIKEISQTLNETITNSEQINSSIQEIAAVSEKSLAGIEETAAIAEENSSSMEEVTESAERLANLAADLSELIKQFKL